MPNESSLGDRFARVWTASIIMVWNIVTVSLRQAITPDELLGRVNSAYQVAAMGMAPLGAISGGLLASWPGLRAPMFIGGLALTATAMAVTPIVKIDSIRAARAEAI